MRRDEEVKTDWISCQSNVWSCQNKAQVGDSESDWIPDLDSVVKLLIARKLINQLVVSCQFVLSGLVSMFN